MKKFGIIISLVLISFSFMFFCGCTHEMVSLYIYKMPNKLVYEIGEELDISGLELKNIKTDSALLKIYNNKANFSGFDSSTSGKKEVRVSYGEFTTSFSVYVANKVVSTGEQLKTAIENAVDGDIILVKQGEYKLDKPIEIQNSDITFGGEGKDKTKIDSFVVLGGYLDGNEINYSGDVQNISFVSIGFETKNKSFNNIIQFENEKINQNIACINAKNISKLNVVSCSFKGYPIAIKAEEMENSYISSNTMSSLLIGGILTTKSTKNVSFCKNIITMIGTNVVNVSNKKEQDYIFGIKLALNSEDNLGISIYKNSISKIAEKNGDLKFFNQKIDDVLSGLNYMHKSGAIILFSTLKNNLQTKGISIFFNSVGATQNNILYNTTNEDRVNSSSVMYMSL